MRKLLCAVCLLALLAGCADTPSPVSAVRSSSTSAAEPADTGELMRFSPFNAQGYFSYFYNEAYPAAGTQLARWDPRDMQMHIACSRSGCSHTNAECEAYANEVFSLMMLPDAVYTLEYGEDGDGMSLVVRDADGTHPRVLNQVGMWIFRGADDEYLYGFCDKAFGRVSRADGSETYLTHDSLSEFVTDGYVAGVWQTAFVCVVCHSSDQIPARVCLLDRDGQITEVAQIDPESLSSPYAVCDGEELYYLDERNGRLTALRLSDASVRPVSDTLCTRMPDGLFDASSWSWSLLGGTLTARLDAVFPEYSQHCAFVVNEDGSLSELPQRQQLRNFDPVRDAGYLLTRDQAQDPVEVLAEYDGQLMVQSALQFFDSGWVGNYALISVDDYLAGRENYREFSSEE